MEKRKAFSELLPKAPRPDRVQLILDNYDKEIQEVLKKEGKQNILTEVESGC